MTGARYPTTRKAACNTSDPELAPILQPTSFLAHRHYTLHPAPDPLDANQLGARLHVARVLWRAVGTEEEPSEAGLSHLSPTAQHPTPNTQHPTLNTPKSSMNPISSTLDPQQSLNKPIKHPSDSTPQILQEKFFNLKISGNEVYYTA